MNLTLPIQFSCSLSCNDVCFLFLCGKSFVRKIQNKYKRDVWVLNGVLGNSYRHGTDQLSHITKCLFYIS